MAVVIGLDPLVAVPVEHAFAHGEGAVEEGDEPDAALQQPPRQQAVAAEAGEDRVGIVQAIKLARGRALARQVADLRGAELHPGGQLVGGDPRRELGIAGVLLEVLVVEQLQEVAARLVVAGRKLPGAGQVADRLVGVERGSLVHGRQEAVGPVGGPLLRVAARVGDGHVGGQVLVLRPERIADPGPDAGETLEREPGAHEHLAGSVGIGLRGQRMDEAEVIGLRGQMGQQVGDVLARLPSGPELPGALVQRAVLALEGDQLLDARASAGRAA